MKRNYVMRSFWQALLGTGIFLSITILVLLPAIGLAQSGGDQDPNQPADNQNQILPGDGAQTSGRTDDPLGRVLIPLEQEPPQPGEKSGNQAMEDVEAASGPRLVSKEEEAKAATAGYTSPLVIPAADFRSDGFDPDSFFFWFSGGYAQGESGGNVNTCLMAPAYLPDGATVDEVYATIYDNDPSYKIWIRLYRVDNFSGTVNEMGSMETTPAYANTSTQVISDISVDYGNVSYPDYSYYLGTCIESNQVRLYSVRLYYTP